MAHIGVPLSIPILIVVGIGLGYARVLSGSIVAQDRTGSAGDAARIARVEHLADAVAADYLRQEREIAANHRQLGHDVVKELVRTAQVVVEPMVLVGHDSCYDEVLGTTLANTPKTELS